MKNTTIAFGTEDKKRIKDAAKKRGLSFAGFVRFTLLERLKNEDG